MMGAKNAILSSIIGAKQAAFCAWAFLGSTTTGGAKKAMFSSVMGAKQAAFCTRAFLGSTTTGTGPPPKTSSGGGDSPNLRHSLEKRLRFVVEGDGGGDGDGVEGEMGGCAEGTVKKLAAGIPVVTGDEAAMDVGEEAGNLEEMEDRYA